MRDRVAIVITLTICTVLCAIVLDLIVTGTLDTGDRGVTLAALGSIGLALAVAIGRYLDGDDPDE